MYYGFSLNLPQPEWLALGNEREAESTVAMPDAIAQAATWIKIMPMAFEDLHAGQRLRFGAYPVTESEIIEFATEFDPQPFHLDSEAAKHSLLGGLAASGWHTCCMAMRMAYDGFLRDSTGVGAPGIEEVRWMKPVRAGMILTTQWTVNSLRVSKSRPELGLAGIFAEVSDQSGLVVMTQRHTNLFERRGPEAPIPEPQGARQPQRREAPPEPPRLESAEANRSRFATWYEDTQIGARLSLGSHRFTREEIMRFARKYDPQPFHLDDSAAAASHFGKLSASGWHTASKYMRLYIDTRERIRAENLARGLPPATNGPSPGFNDLNWFRPVFVDDTIAYETTVTRKRLSSRAGWGFVTSRVHGTNQNGVKVFESSGASMIPMRPAGGAARAAHQ